MKIETTATANFQACKCAPSNGVPPRIGRIRTRVLLPAAPIAKVSCKGFWGARRGSPLPALPIGRLLLGAALLFAGCGQLSDAELAAAAAACAAASPRTVGQHPYFVALNAYYLQEEAARAIRAGEASSLELEEVLQKASALGVTVLRTWAFNDDPGKAGDSAMQVAPLEYDEV